MLATVLGPLVIIYGKAVPIACRKVGFEGFVKVATKRRKMLRL